MSIVCFQEIVYSSSQAKGGHISQTLPKDNEGNLDFRFYSRQLMIEEMRPKMVNVSLLGKIESVDLDSTSLVLRDRTGRVTVQLCPQIFLTNNFEKSRCVLLSNLSTRGGVKTLTVSGSLKEGTSVIDLNVAKGFLNCEVFWNPISLVIFSSLF